MAGDQIMIKNVSQVLVKFLLFEMIFVFPNHNHFFTFSYNNYLYIVMQTNRAAEQVKLNFTKCLILRLFF